MSFVTKVKIRQSTTSDAEQIASLFMKVWHTSLPDLLPAGFLNQFELEKQKEKYTRRALDPDWLILVAELNNKIVGMVAATDNKSEPLSYKKQIRGMYVDPDFQRQGIGTALLHRILFELKQLQIDCVMLWCIAANRIACSFYEKHGGERMENIEPPAEYSAMPHIIYAWDLLRS